MNPEITVDAAASREKPGAGKTGSVRGEDGGIAAQERRVMGARLRLTRPTIPESAILASVLQVLRWHPKCAWARRMNTGAYKPDGARFVRFGFPGLSDVIGQIKPTGAFLAIEIKRSGQNPTEDQQRFLDLVRASGGCSGVARNPQDAVTLVNDFVAVKR